MLSPEQRRGVRCEGLRLRVATLPNLGSIGGRDARPAALGQFVLDELDGAYVEPTPDGSVAVQFLNSLDAGIREGEKVAGRGVPALSDVPRFNQRREELSQLLVRLVPNVSEAQAPRAAECFVHGVHRFESR
jgi:hypothetical protein